MVEALFLTGFMVVAAFFSYFLWYNSVLGWMVVIWGCVMNTVAVSLSVYNGIGVMNCDFVGVFCYSDISCSLVWLSAIVVSLSLLGSWEIVGSKNMESSFLCLVTVLMIVLMFCFIVDSMFVFYVFFEVSLIPTLLIICGWGCKSERLQAGKYMMLYMVAASLPLLVYILMVFGFVGTNSFLLFFYDDSLQVKFLAFFGMSMAFFVKSPVYGVHLWLPKAHVEAPVGGSMVLAGVLLKLGGYGLVRFSSFLEFSGSVIFNCVISLCILGGVFASVACCVQVDAKSLIAYSSVGHMSLVVSGVMCGSCWGLNGSVFLMLAHGLSSCGMFYLVSNLSELYESRMLFVMRGGVGSLFGVNFWLASMCGFNAGMPLSLNFCSEIILYISLMSYSLMFGGFVSILSFLSCLYSWFFYCNTQVGSYPFWVYPSLSMTSKLYLESVICLPIIGFLIGLSFILVCVGL